MFIFDTNHVLEITACINSPVYCYMYHAPKLFTGIRPMPNCELAHLYIPILVSSSFCAATALLFFRRKSKTKKDPYALSIESINEILWEAQRILSLAEQTDLILKYRRLIHELAVESYGFSVYNRRIPPSDLELIEIDFNDISIGKRNYLKRWINYHPLSISSLAAGLIAQDEELAWALSQDI